MQKLRSRYNLVEYVWECQHHTVQSEAGPARSPGGGAFSVAQQTIKLSRLTELTRARSAEAMAQRREESKQSKEISALQFIFWEDMKGKWRIFKVNTTG